MLKIYVEEALSNNQKEIFKRGYQFKDIKKVADIPNSVLPASGGLTDDTSATKCSIADLYEFVKTYDKDFTPAPVVSKVLLNEDGTPKVFYHGTNAEFDSFEKGHRRTSGRLNFGDGFYFAATKKYAENYIYGNDGR